MSNIITKDAKLSLKVTVNKEKTKVLFAEADSDFADVLLSFLTLPLGRIMKLLEKHYADKAPAFGSITSLYKGLANLDDAHFTSSIAKQMLLDPRSSSDSICRNLKLNVGDSTATKYFAEFASPLGLRCALSHNNICMYYCGTSCCNYCGIPLTSEIFVSGPEDAARGFTKKKPSFLISDDMQMVPYSVGFLQSLSRLGVTGAEGAEFMNITLGTDEITDLLMCCLLSDTPLTDLVLNRGSILLPSAKPKPSYYLHKIEKQETSNCEKIMLKITVHKSTNKYLFAQARDDFIEFLFSLLIIPIGGVESLLDNKTCLNNLDNLYKSISDAGVDEYFASSDTKMRLINPTIPYCYKSESTFLPLVEESAPVVYYKHKNQFSHIYTKKATRVSSIKSPKGDGNYVMGPTTFMITDDLTVTPFCMSESFSILKSLNIPLSDVDELEVPIGLQEGLRILKASLTSASVLTNALINHITTKQPKQEH